MMPFWWSCATDWSKEGSMRDGRATDGTHCPKAQLTQEKTLHATERDTARIQQLRVQYWQEMEQ